MTADHTAHHPDHDHFGSWPPSEETLRCPFARFRKARENAPVIRLAEPAAPGVPIYLATGHRACIQVLAQPALFASDLAGVLPGFDKSSVPPPFPDRPTFHDRQVVFFTSGEDHKIKRGWAMELVRRSKLERLRPLIIEEADRLIDAFVDAGHCDFQEQFSNPLPLRVLLHALDLPESALPVIRRMSIAIATTDVNPNLGDEERAAKAKAFGDLFTMIRGLLEERYAHPGDDYISELVKAQVALDGELDVNTLSIHLQGLMFGGDHAVGAHLCHLAVALARDPELQTRLRAEPGLIPRFVLETFRLEAPIPWLFRLCTADTELDGVHIEAGAVIIAATSAANRDPARFPDPDLLSLDRDNVGREHLSLGRGAHRCVGEPLAYLIAEATVTRLLERLDAIRVDTARSDLRARVSLQFRCPERVCLLFDRR
ncbi:cytochrome P450 [Burkholderia multivorans]|uniref:cytochrome P450 n=1 Tax=Burkholderia multivorans TaxID=87883 RepID=UPI001C265E89|nr:cytochrome P450 [Burkholderia multivorans]MBU9598255.1 cytochrome P450 [Burkholderia multivorans]MDN7997001.1 cytochrome P450 [Burkholderia multivorans]